MSSPEELLVLHGIFLEGHDRFNTLAYEPEEAEYGIDEEEDYDTDLDLWLQDRAERGSLRY